MKAEFDIRDQPLQAEISLERLTFNLQTLRGIIGPKVRLCIVAKANCYGHDTALCLPAIVRHADWLATATAHEALQVRSQEPVMPILMLLPLTQAGPASWPAGVADLIDKKIALTISSETDLQRLRDAVGHASKTAQVHIKIDTGMSRSGVRAENAVTFIDACRRLPGVQIEGLYTDLATADETDKAFAHEQLAVFDRVVELAGGRSRFIVHAASSAATLDLPGSHYDMVRIGVSTFGYLPASTVHNRVPLQGILRLTTRLLQIREVPADTTVGYGRTYRFSRPARIGLIAVGYGDGLDRRLSNRAVVRIRGSWVPVRGRVNMDQAVIDLTAIPNAQPDDEVEVISWHREDPNSVESLAGALDTIPNEITTRLGHRVVYCTTKAGK